MSINEVRSRIEHAFTDTPAPGSGFDEISTTANDEGIVDYFRNTTWRGHRVLDLRYHAAALSFFTDKAFRYWLPAFMLAELEDPEAADVIAEGIAFHFTDSDFADARLRQFDYNELEAVAAFLEECAERYGNGCSQFQEAAEAVRRWALKLE